MAVRTAFFLIVLSFITHTGCSQCQTVIDTVDQQQLRRLLLYSGAAYGVAQAGLYTIWYQHQPAHSFQFFNDSPEWKQLDKAGHAYSVFHISRIATQAFRSTGLSSRKSIGYGGLTGFLMMLPTEIMDGFSAAYGASLSDIAANASGAIFFMGQMLLWHQPRIHPKFSFHRTPFSAQRPELLGSNWHEAILKDYNGQTYWWSFDLYSFRHPGSSFPKWLNLAIGYGAHNMIYARDQENEARGMTPYREYYMALDIDLSHYKKSPRTFRNRLWNTFLCITDMVHLPTPALSYRQGKGLKFYPLFF